MTEQGTPTPPVSWETPSTTTGPAPGTEFAPHGARLVAYILDGLIITIVVALLVIVAFIVIGAGLTVDRVTNEVDASSVSTVQWLIFAVLCVLALLISLFYFPFFWARGGQTLGMRPFHLWVVRDRDGSRIGWGAALLRLLGLYVASAVFYLGFIWIFIDKRRRGWQDLIAGTVVIKRP
jgi:uncharacterized RDD family membrane protein YckC